MIQAVVFDMDGVIFDTERAVIDVWKEVADRHGIPDIESFCKECIGTNAAMTKNIFLRRYGNKYSYDDIRAEKTGIIRERFRRGQIATKTGALEILDTLNSNNIKIALASSTREEAVREELTIAGLIEYFDEIITGDKVEHSKPAPDIFLKACEKLGVKPEDAVGIEDSFNGIRSSKAAGLYTIMVPDILAPDEEIKQLADQILPDLNEALKVILTMV